LVSDIKKYDKKLEDCDIAEFGDHNTRVVKLGLINIIMTLCVDKHYSLLWPDGFRI